MNMPKTMARKATSRRGSIRSAPSAAALPGTVARSSAVGLAARAMANLGSKENGLAYAAWLGRAVGRHYLVRVGSNGARLGVDADDDRHAGAQQSLFRDVGWHRDAHRQALDDLGEIAGRVVRRQQREDRAGGRRDTDDAALKLAARIGIDRDRDRLTG